jgi:3-phosphoshikimate 1-carboxyvinyltransferase
MALETFGSTGPLAGEVRVPGDKSISHRALILAALADGPSRVDGLATGADVGSTITCLERLGVRVSQGVVRPPRGGLRPPDGPLEAGNSGTTMRLLAGVLAGQPFRSTLDGDASLRRRPMARVAHPLRSMGAEVAARPADGGDGETAPLQIRGPLPPGPLTARVHRLPVASAQVKTCLLLAGLHAAGRTTVIEPLPSRDHTERLLRVFGVAVADGGRLLCGGVSPGAEADPVGRASSPVGWAVSVESDGRPLLHPVELAVPGDFSSAAFWIVAGLLVPGSALRLAGVGVNPTRTGLLAVLARMGAGRAVALEGLQEAVAAAAGAGAGGGAGAGEPVADIVVRGLEPARARRGSVPGVLRATLVPAAEVPSLIDEVPILAVAATQAEGVTVIEGAGELRAKETDRLEALAGELGRMGAHIEAGPDRLVITGPTRLHPARVSARGDHRMAMALAVAGLLTRPVDGRQTEVAGFETAGVSYPGFRRTLEELAS